MNLCIDIGGTKTAIAYFDKTGSERFYCAFPTFSERGCRELAKRVKEKIVNEQVIFDRGCIASPGPLNQKDGKIICIATMGWKEIAVCDIFREEIGIRFELINDCAAGALGEWRFGQGQDVLNMAYVSVSTGVGGGLIVNGQLYLGRGNSGEIGHLRVMGENMLCPCGARDCLELYASGTGIENGYFRKTGKKISCREISALARQGDKNALSVFEACGRALAEGIECIVKIEDPEKIVLGGGVTADADLFFPFLKKISTKTNIVISKMQGKQVLYGCAAWLQEIEKNKQVIT